MAKYVYPALFIPENEGGYAVEFPDIDGCYTQGETLAEALEMAEDALALMLYDAEEAGREIPPASNIEKLNIQKGVTVSLVHCDTIEYRKYFASKAVKKTLTIPLWLNTLAERKEINFSSVLQNALKKELQIED